MVFYAGPERGVENPSLKDKGFNTSKGAQQLLMYKNIISDHLYCTRTFCDTRKQVNIGVNCYLKNVYLAKSHRNTECFDDAPYMANKNTILMLQY